MLLVCESWNGLGCKRHQRYFSAKIRPKPEFPPKKTECIENFLNLVDSVKLFFIRYKLNNSFEPPEETLFCLIYISCTTAP